MTGVTGDFNVFVRKAGSVLEDQRSHIHMTIARSETGIWTAALQTQWSHTTKRSHLLEESGRDKKILRGGGLGFRFRV